MVRITGHLNIKLSMLPGPGFGKSGQAVDGDNVDPVLNGEVWFGGGRHPRLHPGRVHRLLPNGHLSQSVVRDKKNKSNSMSMDEWHHTEWSQKGDIYLSASPCRLV